jgi:hypothetical protein
MRSWARSAFDVQDGVGVTRVLFHFVQLYNDGRGSQMPRSAVACLNIPEPADNMKELSVRCARPPEVRRADHVIPRSGYFRAVRLERCLGRGDRVRESGDGELTQPHLHRLAWSAIASPRCASNGSSRPPPPRVIMPTGHYARR